MCWKWSNIFISNHIDWIVAVTFVVCVVLKKHLIIMILDKVPPSSVVRQQAFIEARDIDLSEVCPSSSYLIDVLQKKLKGWNVNRKWWLISSLFFFNFFFSVYLLFSDYRSDQWARLLAVSAACSWYSAHRLIAWLCLFVFVDICK